MSVAITMVGTGYVGLVTGACFAELGHDVICVDKEESKIGALLAGEVPIYEPDLDRLLSRNVAAGRLRFATDVAASVSDREAVFITVGTPTDGSSGAADMRYVFAAAEEIARAVTGFTVIVTKSTVPIGSNRQLMTLASRKMARGASIAIASNPEFLREGAAIGDFMTPDRIVIGAEDPRAIELLGRIYAQVVATGARFVATDIETAELIKYAANAFLAMKVSFINEIADLCEAVGADIDSVAHGMGLDSRIGAAFLKPGPGWGGSCFPKDTRALHNTAQAAAVNVRTVEAAIDANAARKKAMARRIVQALGGDVAGKRIAVLGITFKGQTDDMRDSPALEILPQLAARGARVHAFDPSNPREAPHLLPDVTMEATPKAAALGAHILIVLTDWREFLSLDLTELASVMADPILVDLRNLYEGRTALASGFRLYKPVGRVALAR